MSAVLLMDSVCLTCTAVYDQKPCQPEQVGRISHGYCPTCFPAAMAQVQRELVEMGLVPAPLKFSLPAAESLPRAVDAQSISGAVRGSMVGHMTPSTEAVDQAVTPRCGAPDAVAADPSEVLSVADPMPFMTMTTNPIYPDTVPAVPGMESRRVARATGLSAAELVALHTSDMVAPLYFFHRSGATGDLFYTVAGLSRLVEIFYAAGRKPLALVLRAELDYLQVPAPAVRAPAGVNHGGEWARSRLLAGREGVVSRSWPLTSREGVAA